MRNTTKKQLILLVAGCLLVGGLLTGCGSSSAAASTDNGNGSGQTQQNAQGQTGQKHRGNFNFAAQLQKAGLSQTDAQNLANLIRTKHVQPKWVLDQVNNKVPVSQITDDINNGKAPIMQRNGNGKGNWNGNGGNGSNGAGTTGSNGSSGNSSNSGSSNGTSN